MSGARRTSQMPVPGGSSGLPRPASRQGSAGPSSALPRPSSSTASAAARAQTIRNGINSAAPDRRTYTASGLPSLGASRSTAASGGTEMLGSQQLVGSKRRASSSSQATSVEQLDAIDHVFDVPLLASAGGIEEGGPPLAKRPFGHSRLGSNSALSTDGTPISSHKKASQRESLTSIADISAVRHDYQVRLVHSESRISELERQLLESTRTIERFQRERLEMLSEWEALQTQKTAREKQHGDEVEKLRADLKEYMELLGTSEGELGAATNELEELKQTSKAESTKLQLELIEARNARQEAEEGSQRKDKIMQGLKNEVEELRSAASVRRDPTMTQGRRAFAKTDHQDGADSSEGAKAADLLRKELHRQVAHLQKLEVNLSTMQAENTRLASQVSSIEVLREEKRGVESRLRGLEVRNEELGRFETEVKSLKEDLRKWEQCLEGLTNPSSGGTDGNDVDRDEDLRAALRIAESASFETDPAADVGGGALRPPSRPASFTRQSLRSYLGTLESSLSVSLSKNRGLLELLKRARAEQNRVEEEVEMADKRVLEAEKKISKSRVAIERAELAESRARDERDRYKTLLDSFQMEQKIKKSSYDETNLQRIDLLATQLEEYQAANVRLEAEIKALSQESSERQIHVEGLQTQLEKQQQQQNTGPSEEQAAATTAAMEELTATITALEKELERIGEENEKLWMRVGRGEFDQVRIQVLTLAANPLSQSRDLRAARLDGLKKENEELLKKVDQLSADLAAAGGGGSGGAGADGNAAGEETVPRAVFESLQLEISGLHASIAVKDKAMLRLKQVFNAKASEFREAVTCLFGWKLRFMESGKVKLTSSFSRSSSATTLVFKSQDGNVGDMRLTGEAINGGLADVQGLSEKWLRQEALYSIPCFLAELNQQLFESCTRVARAYGYLDDEDAADS